VWKLRFFSRGERERGKGGVNLLKNIADIYPFGAFE